VNIPDRWVVVKISAPARREPVYKVFAVWFGGVFETDYWKLNSGIKGVEVGEDAVLFKGYSGSEYYCALDYYGLNGYGEGILNYMIANASASIEILPSTTDWKALV
jgi:hypothetical protein